MIPGQPAAPLRIRPVPGPASLIHGKLGVHADALT
jgi:hypothetical protein